MKRALVIDDSKAMRRILRNILQEIDFEVIEAGDGQQALDRLQENPDFEVALVDWNMPNVNGYEFIKAVRANPDWHRLTLMMVTTESETNRVVAALAAGANEYVMKPFTREVILDKLQLMGLLR